MKQVLMGAIPVLIALVIYDKFIKKMINKEA